MSSPSPQPEKVKKSDGNEDGLGCLVMIVGAIVAWNLIPSCSSKKKEEPAPDPIISTLGTRPIALLNSVDEASSLIARGKLLNQVEEVAPFGSDSFTYLFHGKDSEISALRGVSSGTERTAVLEKLRSSGVTIDTKFPSTSAGGSQVLVTGQTSLPWYERLIWPGIALVALGLAWRTIGNPLKGILETARKRLGRSSGGGRDGDDKFSLLVQRPSERLKDWGGNRSTAAFIGELVSDIKSYQRGDSGASIPRGVLLHGDPGVGKTLSGRIIAGEVDAPFFPLNASDLLSSPYQGDWTQTIRDLFKQAREEKEKIKKRGVKNPVVIVCLDEFDSLGRKRGNDRSNNEHEKAVNALLHEMDGLDKSINEGIIILAATNNVDVIDPALKRPGRFARQLELRGPQNSTERLDVLKKVAARIKKSSEVKLESDKTLDAIAAVTTGMSPDHLRGVVQRAAELARRDTTNPGLITETCLFEALQQQLAGPPSGATAAKSRRQLVSAHEHGHGIMAHVLGVEPVVVSMRARGDSLGRVIADCENLLEAPSTRRDILKYLLFVSGGRAGEIARGGIAASSIGVSGDFETITSVAKQYFSAGLSHGKFALSFKGATEHELPDELRADITSLGNKAVEAAEAVLAVVGKDAFLAIVEDTVSKDYEVCGEAARNFYKSRIPDPALRKSRAVVAKFLKDPLAFKAADGLATLEQDDSDPFQHEAPPANQPGSTTNGSSAVMKGGLAQE